MYLKDSARYSDNQIAKLGIDPARAGFIYQSEQKPPYDPLTQRLIDAGDIEVNGQWYIDWQIEQITPAEQDVDFYRAEIKQKIADMVLKKLYENSLFDFGGVNGYVQLRNARDESNLHTAATNAAIMHVLGDGAQSVKFRDAANVVHTTTATQFMTECKRFFDAKQAVYQASWRHKEAIKLLDNIPDLRAYDYTTGWPS